MSSAQKKESQNPVLSDKQRMEDAIKKLEGLDAELADFFSAIAIDLETAIDDADDARGDATFHEDNAAQLQNELEDAQDKINELELNNHTVELAKIRTDLFNGRVDQGRERLERVLNDLDSGWRMLA
jgi:predicted  nucleic acid-binding Zn-ribbon protein